MNTENSKTNESHKFVLNLSQRFDLRSSNKHVYLQTLSIYYIWKNIRQQCKNNKAKIVAPTWNDEFEKRITKKHKTLLTNLSIHIYINRINKRLLFKIKDGHKLELQSPETMELFGSTKKLIGKIQNGENVSSLEVVGVVFVQCNLIGNQDQQKSEVLHFCL